MSHEPIFLIEVYFWWQASELLGHPHLQSYVLKIHLKINSPRRSTLPAHWPGSNYMKKTRFLVPEDDSVSICRDKRHSFINDRTLNPSVSGADQDSVCSTLEIDCTPGHLNQRLDDLCTGDRRDVKSTQKPVVLRTSSIAKTPRFSSSTVSATNRKSMEPSKNLKVVRQTVSLSSFFGLFPLFDWRLSNVFHVVYSLSVSPWLNV